MRTALEGHFDLPLSYTSEEGKTVILAEVVGGKMWQLDGVENIDQAIGSLTGMSPPQANTFTEQDEERLVWQGRNRYFWLTNKVDISDENGIYATDQSQSKTQLQVSGNNARVLLSRGLQVNINDEAMPVLSAVMTHINHVGVTVLRLPDVDGAPVFELWVMRGFAVSLVEFLMVTAETL